MSDIAVKICGLRTASDVAACVHAGARYVGLVFFPKSPRHLSLNAARDLALGVPVGIAKVALTVNASDTALDELVEKVPLDMLQLHGAETPERAAEIRARYGLPVMKALGIATDADLEKIDAYTGAVDQLLIDAKPAGNADLPGGNGLSFDWRLIAGRKWGCPWMLAGGLTPENVGEAIRLTGARQVDVSSGVEMAPGRKSPNLIDAFVAAAQA
ncbi:MAG: phosphoribosylanthranilate isomerase [Pseudomonadota bacterium]